VQIEYVHVKKFSVFHDEFANGARRESDCIQKRLSVIALKRDQAPTNIRDHSPRSSRRQMPVDSGDHKLSGKVVPSTERFPLGSRCENVAWHGRSLEDLCREILLPGHVLVGCVQHGR
jgi:hypothetical protein